MSPSFVTYPFFVLTKISSREISLLSINCDIAFPTERSAFCAR